MAFAHSILSVVRALGNMSSAISAGLAALDQILAKDVGPLTAFAGITLRDTIDGNDFWNINKNNLIQGSP